MKPTAAARSKHSAALTPDEIDRIAARLFAYLQNRDAHLVVPSVGEFTDINGFSQDTLRGVVRLVCEEVNR